MYRPITYLCAALTYELTLASHQQPSALDPPSSLDPA